MLGLYAIETIDYMPFFVWLHVVNTTVPSGELSSMIHWSVWIDNSNVKIHVGSFMLTSPELSHLRQHQGMLGTVLDVGYCPSHDLSLE